MNDKIKEFAKQSGYDWNWDTQVEFSHTEMLQFADLIIKECENVALKVSFREDDMGAIIANMIRKHFEVY